MDRWAYSTPYRLEDLDDANTLYVQINEIANNGEMTMAEFMSTAVTEAERRSVDKFVLDLRKNHGGSGSWNRGVILALLNSPRVNQFGRLYVLIGRQTFSAAIMLGGLLEEWTEALFVGEPPGSALNQYGDPDKFQLENSGLTVRVSTIYWHSWLAGDNRPAYPPHVLVDYDSADYFGGVDPILETALAHQVPAGSSDRFRLLLESDVNQAAIWILKQMSDPAVSSVDIETTLERVGRELVNEGQLDTGRYAYLIGINFFPESETLKTGLESIPEPED